MLVVALDTSTDMLACACAEWTAAPDGGGVELLSHQDHMCRRHANVELVNTVDAVLQDAGASMDKVGAVLVGRGPGSFTGVRIGISTAKGLARGAGVPLYGVSTLDASAWLRGAPAFAVYLAWRRTPCAARCTPRSIALMRTGRTACLSASALSRRCRR